MKAVEHGDERYLLVKQSSESSRVRDPATGEEQYLPNEELTVLDEQAESAVVARCSEQRAERSLHGGCRRLQRPVVEHGQLLVGEILLLAGRGVTDAGGLGGLFHQQIALVVVFDRSHADAPPV